MFSSLTPSGKDLGVQIMSKRQQVIKNDFHSFPTSTHLSVLLLKSVIDKDKLGEGGKNSS